MCGIAGMIDPAQSAETRAVTVNRMCEAMKHRGPDDAGIESLGGVTLGMRRLAIFDPANGHQPMRTPDGQVTLVFNGAIYNFRELRRELEATGWIFRTQCDTEVLLAAYARWGEACISRLRGMYAFAAWNETKRSLFLARDPFGIKPLYYHQGGASFQFASEINALVASRTFATEVDVAAVVDYLGWLAVPAPRTIYRNVHSLQPGDCLTYANGQVTIRSSWSFAQAGAGATPCRTRDEFIRELRGRLDDSIRAHVLADVPVGAFLSGGLDSAVVAGLMTRATGSRLRTFSIGFDETAYSEAAAARETAGHLGTDHSTLVLRGRDVANDLDAILATLDQPTGDGINTYYVSRLARAGGVTVALSGLGGDELFGGYPSFRDLPRLNRWLPAWRALPASLQRKIVGLLNRGDTRQRKLADFLTHARHLVELGALQRRVFSDSTRRSLLTPETQAVADRASPFHPQLSHLGPELERAGAFETTSAWELRTYMADVLLRDSDVMSMRHSLELRVPFVDRPFIEWLWAQPAEFKFDRRRPKAVLAEATQDVLPPVLARRPKRGFTLPFAVWMKQDLRPFLDETFAERSVGRSGLFDSAAVQQLWRGFLAQNDTREWSRVWSLAMLIAFLNRR
jgi:asparagine synthase (glutamine-hydrolysing)